MGRVKEEAIETNAVLLRNSSWKTMSVDLNLSRRRAHCHKETASSVRLSFAAFSPNSFVDILFRAEFGFVKSTAFSDLEIMRTTFTGPLAHSLSD